MLDGAIEAERFIQKSGKMDDGDALRMDFDVSDSVFRLESVKYFFKPTILLEKICRTAYDGVIRSGICPLRSKYKKERIVNYA